jgi:predicted GNAT family N-acyltransferase
VQLIEFGALSEPMRSELEGDEEDPFEMARSPLQWRPKDRHVGLRAADGRLVASAGCVLSELELEDGSALTVVGVGGVIVARAFRGQGLGDRIIAEVVRLADRLGPPMAMLFCRRDRADLYARHGFIEIAGPVFAEQPSGLVEVSLVAMARPLRLGATVPSGRVTVRGLPF